MTLTHYRLSASSIFGQDLVSGFALGRNGVNDSVVEFTLAVVPVPVPVSYAPIIAGLALLGLAGRRRPTR